MSSCFDHLVYLAGFVLKLCKYYNIYVNNIGVGYVTGAAAELSQYHDLPRNLVQDFMLAAGHGGRMTTGGQTVVCQSAQSFLSAQNQMAAAQLTKLHDYPIVNAFQHNILRDFDRDRMFQSSLALLQHIGPGVAEAANNACLFTSHNTMTLVRSTNFVVNFINQFFQPDDFEPESIVAGFCSNTQPWAVQARDMIFATATDLTDASLTHSVQFHRAVSGLDRALNLEVHSQAFNLPHSLRVTTEQATVGTEMIFNGVQPLEDLHEGLPDGYDNFERQVDANSPDQLTDLDRNLNILRNTYGTREDE